MSIPDTAGFRLMSKKQHCISRKLIIAKSRDSCSTDMSPFQCRQHLLNSLWLIKLVRLLVSWDILTCWTINQTVILFSSQIQFRFLKKLLDYGNFINLTQKQPYRGVFRKRCFENMKQIYWRTLMPKCDFSKVAKQLYWNHTSA